MKQVNSLLAATGTKIVTVMSVLAVRHGAISFGQGLSDMDGPADLLQAAADALFEGRNQLPPIPGRPEFRQAVAAHDRRFLGIEVDPMREVVVTSGAAGPLGAWLNPSDEVVLVREPLYDTDLPELRLLGAVPRLVRLNPPGWDYHVQNHRRLRTRTQAILLNTPMNPASKAFATTELKVSTELLVNHDAYAISEEVYDHLTFDGRGYVPLCRW